MQCFSRRHFDFLVCADGGGCGTKKIIECEERIFSASHFVREKAGGLKVAVSRKIKPSLLQSRLYLRLSVCPSMQLSAGSASSKKCVCSQITRRSLMLDWAFIAKIITAREGWTASSRQWIFAPSIVAFSKEHSREIFYGINCHRERKMECPWSESIICDLFLFGKFFQKGHAPPYVPKVKETFFLTIYFMKKCLYCC